MPSCEKCWRDAHKGWDIDVATEYARLIEERNATGPCTPEEQAGEYATECPECLRMTVDQHCRICMVCGKEMEA